MYPEPPRICSASLTHCQAPSELNTCQGPRSKVNMVSLVPDPFQKEDLRMGMVQLGTE